ncbi:MAG: lysoplasmalogenase [Lachnospiraceae bacterium]|nr:lysoplasmalogenase [Lachnospiraceae bacterium]
MINAFTIVLCLVGMLIQLVFIYSEYRNNMFAAVWLKGLAAAVFVWVGFRGLQYAGQSRFADTVVTGLVLGAIGDVFLNIRYLTKKYEQLFFIGGIISFFMGHVMYLISMIPYCDQTAFVLIAGITITLVLYVLTWRTIKANKVLMVFGAIYIPGVVFMAVAAMGNLISVQNTNRVIFAIGALFFLVSDIILIFNTFGPKHRFPLSALTLVLYYIGQSLIACSVGYLP